MPGGRSSKAAPENSCKFGIWKQQFCLWTQSLNVLNQSFLFLPQFLHLEYGNVVKYRDGVVVDHKFKIIKRPWQILHGPFYKMHI